MKERLTKKVILTGNACLAAVKLEIRDKQCQEGQRLRDTKACLNLQQTKSNKFLNNERI